MIDFYTVRYITMNQKKNSWVARAERGLSFSRSCSCQALLMTQCTFDARFWLINRLARLGPGFNRHTMQLEELRPATCAGDGSLAKEPSMCI